MSVGLQWPASAISTSQLGEAAAAWLFRMNRFPSSVMLLSSFASRKRVGIGRAAMVGPGSSGLSIGAAMAKTAFAPASRSPVQAAVAAPKLWPITPTRSPSNDSPAWLNGPAVSKAAAAVKSMSCTRVSRKAALMGAGEPEAWANSVFSAWSGATTAKPYEASCSAAVKSSNRVQPWQWEKKTTGSGPSSRGRASRMAPVEAVTQAAGAAT